MLKRGRRGCDVNPTEAVRLYREAADQGHAGAQYRLGQMSEYGIGCGKIGNRNHCSNWLTNRLSISKNKGLVCTGNGRS
ncbi:tetratricopeptide repeat protein [Phyllobacterium sp. CCNWLW109]|uniref:tetratricopeptide repeat protein n=1 Tax=Phyllobacterium sp. CCNWLW109 TaxID=3127479 RepID=UPI003FCC9056